MRNTAMKTMTLMFGLMLSTAAFAQAPLVRAGAEQARINQGLATGELTGREAARLERREMHLNREIARGVGNRRVERQQNRLSRSIYREKHDGQVR
jgi:hypothetical protein